MSSLFDDLPLPPLSGSAAATVASEADADEAREREQAVRDEERVARVAALLEGLNDPQRMGVEAGIGGRHPQG